MHRNHYQIKSEALASIVEQKHVRVCVVNRNWIRLHVSIEKKNACVCVALASFIVTIITIL